MNGQIDSKTTVNPAKDLVHGGKTISDVPSRVKARTNVQAFSVTYPDAIAMYHADGSLWFAMDRNTLETLKPAAPVGLVYSDLIDGTDAHRRADETPELGFVYFIGRAGCDQTPIKIGRTVDLKARHAAIQACSPVAVEVLASRQGGAIREGAYHAQFAEHRLHGEWFAPHPDILSEIERLKGQADA